MKCTRILLLVLVLLVVVAAPHFPASAQEFSGAWTHISGDNGLDGFDLGAALWPHRRVSLAFDYDSAWDTSNLGAFALTSVGLISIHSHLQDFLIGPRIHFPIYRAKSASGCGGLGEKYLARLSPFAEVQFGASHLSESLNEQASSQNVSASDNAFTWMLGAGGDYRITPHWVGRVKLDYLRTHFENQGQGRYRFSLGVAYTLRPKQ